MGNRKILIFNTIIDEKSSRYFSDVIARRISFGIKYQITTLGDPLPDSAEFTHLLLTGSELSAAEGSKWDEQIFFMIKKFLHSKKPILGICHGHQMLARAISQTQVCRRSFHPEFGWKKMEIINNPLFLGVTQPIFLESRYDEVSALDDNFEIIAGNDQLPIQAFQWKKKPVWGVQFHPEMLWEEGNDMLEKHFQKNPYDRKFWKNEMSDSQLIKDNLRIFWNFLSF